jgi:DNA-binding CsgD family transcriptional regulator
LNLPPGSIVGGAALLPTKEFVKSEFYNDFLRHQDIFDVLGALLETRKPRCATASVFRPKRAGDFGADEHKLMGVLSPHLQRAVEIRRRLAGLRMRADAVLDMLDRLPTGVIILDGRARVLAMNRRAREIVAQRDGLGIGSAGIEAATPRQTRELRALIGQTAKTSAGEGVAAGRDIVLLRPSDKHPLEVLITPIRLPERICGSEVPAVGIFVTDPERQPRPATDVLRRHHCLTLAEARLTAALAGGASLKDFAEEAQISMNTARWTLKQVFAKTDTSRQAELVR